MAAVWSFLGICVSAALTVVSLALTRRNSRDNHEQLRQTETFRRIQWAVELALDGNKSRAKVGIASLLSLEHLKLITPDDRNYLSDIMRTLIDASTIATEEEP